MFERRKDERTLTLKTGTIMAASEGSAINCVILDISEGGARILVPTSAEIPKVFTLSIDQTKTTYSCALKWNTGNRIGVSFK